MKIKAYGDWYLWKHFATAYVSATNDQVTFPAWIKWETLQDKRNNMVDLNCGCAKYDWPETDISKVAYGMIKNWEMYTCDAKACINPADWYPLTPQEAWKVVACPSYIPLGSKLYISKDTYANRREVVCRDRWGVIKEGRLDLRVWFWEVWMLNLNKTTGLYERWELHVWIK